MCVFGKSLKRLAFAMKTSIVVQSAYGFSYGFGSVSPSSLHTQSTENLPILRLGIFCFPIGSSCSSALATLVGLLVFVMPVKSSSSEDSSTSSETDSDWTRNDGSTSEEEEEEIPANQSLRGMACLVTAACPRKYPRALKERKASRLVLPEDFSKRVIFGVFFKT